ncbi:hypothetical protein PG990_004424 [Apiospora arundinis]
MSNNQPERTSDTDRYRSADEIIRSILDDQTSTSAEISPSGELFRAIERFHANAHRRPGLVQSARRDLVRSHLSRWASASASASATASTVPSRSPSLSSMSSEAQNNASETRRRFSREPQQPTNSGTPSLPPLRSLTSSRRPPMMSAPGSSTMPGRSSRWRGSDRFSDRNRHGIATQPATGSGSNSNSNSNEQTDHMMQLLFEQQNPRRPRGNRAERGHSQLDSAYSQRQFEEDAGTQLRALLDFTNTPNSYSELSFPSPPLQSLESTDEGRRAKRRKLDSDRLTTGFKGFRYGKFGQVEPGTLTMEMVSCDGGIYSDDGQSYAAENILKNDPTVYCTKGPRCNIVLRHQGATAFTLKELVIRAPRSNYTSPVQEGMVFISMDHDELLARTAQYQIQYMPTRSTSRREAQPLAQIVSIRHNEDGSTMTRAQARARRLYNMGLDDEDNDYRVAQLPSEFTVTPPPFRVTIECDDEDDDDGLARSDWRTPRIGSLPFESDSSDDAGNLDDFGLIGNSDNYRRPHRARRSAFVDLETSTPSREISQQPEGGEMMAPNARFFIERDKSRCTIRFDPPVSGRFILLKMWSPHRDPASNIDIQAVVAKGFAGPRYFPNVELR